jgi:hypothetical protein
MALKKAICVGLGGVWDRNPKHAVEGGGEKVGGAQ